MRTWNAATGLALAQIDLGGAAAIALSSDDHNVIATASGVTWMWELLFAVARRDGSL